MTEEELKKIEFKFTSHLALENEHRISFCNEKFGFYIIHIRPRTKDSTFGRQKTHYMYNDQIYKSKKKFLEAIKDVPYFKILRNETE